MSNLIQKINKFFFNPVARFNFLIGCGFYNYVQDDKFVKKRYKLLMGKELNLENPQTFNEKLQWLKLYDRRPEYTTMADKYAVKEYIASIIGKEHVIPLLGVWNHFDEIDFNQLPDQFVLKCTHDSGGHAICTDKSKFDYEDAKKRIERSLKVNYYRYSREWPYKDIPHRIIAEKYMIDDSGYELKDYKFFCFDGVVKFFKIDFDRYIEHRASYFTTDGKLLPFGEAAYPPDFERKIEMPKKLNEMILLAERLSEGHPFLRVDFYEANGQVYFGELTFFPMGGFGPFTDETWDYKIGEWIILPNRK